MITSVQIIAHRGASYDAPENTLALIRFGWSQQADAVEIDIHLTREGEIVLSHDNTFQRTAGHSGDIATLDLATIRTLDAGRWKGEAFTGEKVPVLAEVLATVPEDKGIVIEIKSKGTSMVAALKRALEAGPIPLERVFLIAFDYEILKVAKAALPASPAFYLASGSHQGRQRTMVDLDGLIAQAHAADFDGLNLGEDWPIDGVFVRRVQDAGLKCYVVDPEITISH